MSDALAESSWFRPQKTQTGHEVPVTTVTILASSEEGFSFDCYYFSSTFERVLLYAFEKQKVVFHTGYWFYVTEKNKSEFVGTFADIDHAVWLLKSTILHSLHDNKPVSFWICFCTVLHRFTVIPQFMITSHDSFARERDPFTTIFIYICQIYLMLYRKSLLFLIHITHPSKCISYLIILSHNLVFLTNKLIRHDVFAWIITILLNLWKYMQIITFW